MQPSVVKTTQAVDMLYLAPSYIKCLCSEAWLIRVREQRIASLRCAARLHACAIACANSATRARRRRSSAACMQYINCNLQFFWVELISNFHWLKCLLLVNDNLVTKGGCLVAAIAISKTHMTFIIEPYGYTDMMAMESPEQRT